MKRKPAVLLTAIFVSVIAFAAFVAKSKKPPQVDENISNQNQVSHFSPEGKLPSPSPIPSPTPKPLTFSQLNSLYGPCVRLPVLMYHHIQDNAIARKGGYEKLNVDTGYFQNQMQYLKDKGYSVLRFEDIVNFFDSGNILPQKSAILTFDDGYEDFYTKAYPVLKEYRYHASVFLPTGLMDNPGYLRWEEIQEMSSSGLIFFGNHTWSHRALASSKDAVAKEIKTADVQLTDRNLNNLKVFAYPYGNSNQFTTDELQNEGYLLAFTSKSGSALCKKQRFYLPRLRIGNTNLNYYGL